MASPGRPTFWVGTSGYDYPEWYGSFYPSTVSRSGLLGYYAERFPTVEINATSYRMPSAAMLDHWKHATPEAFRLTLKAPRRITADLHAEDSRARAAVFCRLARRLEGKLGVLLFQVPDTTPRDLAGLETFATALPADLPIAIELRHPSWLDDEVIAWLRARSYALCVVDSEERSTPVAATATVGYVRLRDEGYTDADLARWAERIANTYAECSDVYVYFRHEARGLGPRFAEAFMGILHARKKA